MAAQKANSADRVTEMATKLFPDAEVALIEETNHMVPLLEPDAIGLAIANFSGRHRIADAIHAVPA